MTQQTDDSEQAYAEDEAAFARTQRRSEAGRYALVGAILLVVALPAVVASIFMNMDSNGAGHVLGLVGVFSGLLGGGCWVAALAAAWSGWRG